MKQVALGFGHKKRQIILTRFLAQNSALIILTMQKQFANIIFLNPYLTMIFPVFIT